MLAFINYRLCTKPQSSERARYVKDTVIRKSGLGVFLDERERHRVKSAFFYFAIFINHSIK